MVKWINDAGHGGSDSGAVANGIHEKVWCLESALYVDKRLKEHGISSDLTRKSDRYLSPKERTDIVKGSGAKYCLSHHFNAGGGEGVETIHSIFASDTKARRIAISIRDAGMKLRRVFTRKGSSGKDYYFMHRMTGNVQTTIIEYGFLDNNRDFNKLKNKNFRIKLYESVVKAVCGIEGVTYKEPINETDSKIYRVQVGAFNSRKNADNLSKELRSKGYDTYIVEK